MKIHTCALLILASLFGACTSPSPSCRHTADTCEQAADCCDPLVCVDNHCVPLPGTDMHGTEGPDLRGARVDAAGMTAPDASMPPPDAAMGCGPVDTPQNCGTCGNACPGNGLGNDDVTCTNGSCSLSCRGENYDVNGKAADGCEVLHTGPGHTAETAGSLGSQDCEDSHFGGFTGKILSDARVHANPALDSFSAAVGSAPDVWAVYATGGFTCENDYLVEFSTSGGGTTPCYVLNFDGHATYTLTGSGSTSISGGSGSYPSDSTLYFTVSKTCSLPVQEAVTYTVSFHL